jgi:hypothetical protein
VSRREHARKERPESFRRRRDARLRGLLITQTIPFAVESRPEGFGCWHLAWGTAPSMWGRLEPLQYGEGVFTG